MSGWLELRARSEQRYRDSMPERGFLNTAANAHFRKLESGKSMFYPQGVYARVGYVISSAEQEMLLRQNAREYRKVLSVLYPIVSVAFGAFFRQMEFWQHVTWIAGFIALDWVVAKAYFWRFTRKMESADVPNSPVTYWRSLSQTLHPLSLVLQTILVAGMAGACLYYFIHLREPILLLIGLSVVAGLVPFVVALRSWWSNR